MRPLLFVLVFFLIYRGPVQAQPLHDLLALIEAHNPELQEQRRLLDATAADGGDGAEVLHLLQRQDRSFWRYFALSGRAGGKATPGDEGTGGDVRLSLD